jgi:membrane-associated protease RseP (regulator of RpoE activity)
MSQHSTNMTQSTRLNWKLPLLLYLATWVSTTFCRFLVDDNIKDNVLYNLLLSLCLSVAGTESASEYWLIFGQRLWDALLFSTSLMLILTCHELGHYIQSRRYRLRSSLPFFLPMPFGPLGTFGAVIVMDDEVPNSRALFDIGITGPLAGLIPTLIFLYYGIQWSYLGPRQPGGLEFGDPLLFQWTVYWIFGLIPPDMMLHWHPVAFAAWAGLLLTTLNLMPFSQLDGGHVFYALLGRKSVPVVHCIFVAVIIAIAWFQLWHWSLLLILIALIGISHPPTADDTVPLKPFRHCLGWATLLFVFIGFAPTPLNPYSDEPPKKPIWYCLELNPASTILVREHCIVIPAKAGI